MNQRQIIDQPYEISLADVYNLAVKNKKTILLSVIFTFTFGLLFVCFRPESYQTQALIQVLDKQLGSSPEINKLLGSATQISEVEVQKSLLTSVYVLGPVIEQLGLNLNIRTRYFPFFKSVNTSPKLELAYLKLPLAYEATAKKLKLIAGKRQTFKLYDSDNQLLVEGDIGKELFNPTLPLSIKVSALDARPGTQFTMTKYSIDDTIIALRKAFSLKDLGVSKTGNNSTGLVQLSYTASEPQQAVDIINAIIKTLIEKNKLHKNQQIQQAAQLLHNQLLEAKNALLQAENRLTQYQSKQNQFDPKYEAQHLEDEVASLQQSIRQNELQKAQLLEQLTPAHPYVIMQEAKIKAQQLKLSQLQARLSKLPVVIETYNNLTSAVRIANELYMAIESKLKEIESLKTSSNNNFQVLSWGQYPLKPVDKKPLLILLASILAGLVLGVTIIMLKSIRISH